jgi:TPR repeat protein
VSTKKENNSLALVRRPSGAVEKAQPGARRILSAMTAETLAVAVRANKVREEQATAWFEKGKQLMQKAAEVLDHIRQVVVRLEEAAQSAGGQEAIKCFRVAAELGHAGAQNELGNLYASGRGVPENDETAFHWWRLAADQGHAKARCMVADCYRAGLGTERDIARAVQYYCRAGANGCAGAYSSLAHLYEDGNGVPQDSEEALSWWKKAAEAGDWGAAKLLGCRYRLGKGVARDDCQAAKWFRIAADRGDSMSQQKLGWLYLNGSGVERDVAEAIKWLRRASAKGYPRAQMQLGQLFLQGRGVPQDPAEAACWFHKAADQGDPEACEMLGFCFERGRGLPRDLAEAFLWYSLAADGENSSAQRKLKRLANKITPMELAEGQTRYRARKALDLETESLGVNEIGRCPLCNGWVVAVSSDFSCRRRGCRFRLNRLISHHRITHREMQDLLRSSRTGLLGGFISKSGARFCAHLALDKSSGKLSLEHAAPL